MLAAVLALCGAASCGPSNGGGNPANYLIVFTLSSTTDDLVALEFSVAYQNGNFTGTGTDVSCSLVDSGDDVVLNDDNAGTLSVTIDATDDELLEDDDILECEFVSTVQPTSNDFTITVEDADPADPGDVDVVVTSTDLEGEALVARSGDASGAQPE